MIPITVESHTKGLLITSPTFRIWHRNCMHGWVYFLTRFGLIDRAYAVRRRAFRPRKLSNFVRIEYNGCTNGLSARPISTSRVMTLPSAISAFISECICEESESASSLVGGGADAFFAVPLAGAWAIFGLPFLLIGRLSPVNTSIAGSSPACGVNP